MIDPFEIRLVPQRNHVDCQLWCKERILNSVAVAPHGTVQFEDAMVRIPDLCCVSVTYQTDRMIRVEENYATVWEVAVEMQVRYSDGRTASTRMTLTSEPVPEIQATITGYYDASDGIAPRMGTPYPPDLPTPDPEPPIPTDEDGRPLRRIEL